MSGFTREIALYSLRKIKARRGADLYLCCFSHMQKAGFLLTRLKYDMIKSIKYAKICAFIFEWAIIILAGNKDNHKSMDVFEFLPDSTTDYKFSCPWMSKKINVSTFSRLPMTKSFLNLQIRRKCIISWMNSNFGQIAQQTNIITCPWPSKKVPKSGYDGEHGVSVFIGCLPTWDLFKIFWWLAGYQVSDRCPLGYLFYPVFY